MFITKLLAWFKALFLPRRTATFEISQTPNPNPVDESAVITGIRLQMMHLTQLSAIHHDNYLMQWKAYTANIKAQTESVVFMVAAKENKRISAEYDSLRCKMLMQFNKFDNLFLDSGNTSSNWNSLREDIIASPSNIGAHAMMSKR